MRNSSRKKHNRRTAKEINRQYICPYKNCQKVYGSEGSLNLHIKIKHNGGNKTDREKLAKTIIMAHMKGHLCQVIDQIDLNLPPGTISKAAKKYGLTGQVEHQVLQQIYQRMQNKQEDALERIKMIPEDHQPQPGLMADLDEVDDCDGNLVMNGTLNANLDNFYTYGGAVTYGATDDLGFKAADKPVHVHDLQATLLHLLGLDHERLTFRHSGRDFRLTDVHGRVITDWVA